MQCTLKVNCCTEKVLIDSGAGGGLSPADRELTWIDVAGLFPAPKECLAAFIAVAAAEVLSGIKPANMIRIPNQKLPCGRRMYHLWQQFGADLLRDLPLCVMPMQTVNDSVLLLIYRSDLLERRLRGRTMQVFLTKRGYPQPLTLETTLQYLQKLFMEGIPHEVGMFLGYPLKDVKRFMAQDAEPVRNRGMWRIYGPPARSLKLSNLYRSKRQEMIARLSLGGVPHQLLQVA